jgi:ComF family protein
MLAAHPVLRAAILDALAVLSPVACAGCGARDRSLCDACRVRLAPRVTPHELKAGLRVYAGLEYDGPVRRTILAFKEQHRTDVARALAEPLRAAVGEAAIASAGPLHLVTVPPSRASFRRRGYDPVQLLCRQAGLRALPALRSTRHTASQKTLGADDRAANLVGSLRATRSLAGGHFLLVDDVVTTGATLAEAARAIREAGGIVDTAVAVAFTPRLFSRPATASGIHSDIADRGV